MLPYFYLRFVRRGIISTPQVSHKYGAPCRQTEVKGQRVEKSLQCAITRIVERYGAAPLPLGSLIIIFILVIYEQPFRSGSWSNQTAALTDWIRVCCEYI